MVPLRDSVEGSGRPVPLGSILEPRPPSYVIRARIFLRCRDGAHARAPDRRGPPHGRSVAIVLVAVAVLVGILVLVVVVVVELVR
ncbi:MAG: hypothetical protein KC933_26855, partial [Myxococcales bacterium]|nr:hypothetical protein [Myxococcales bacterium]